MPTAPLQTASPNERPEHDIKLYQIVRLLSESFGGCRVPLHCHYYSDPFFWVYGAFREWLVPLVGRLAMSFLGHFVCHWTSPGTQLSPVAPRSCHMQQQPHLLNQVRVTDGSQTLGEFGLGSVSPTACKT